MDRADSSLLHVEFDPYQFWLGIPQAKQPATYYDLLGISLNEENADEIRRAAEIRRCVVESMRGKGHDEWIAPLVGEINEAEETVLDPVKRAAYDQEKNLFHKRELSRQIGAAIRMPEGSSSSNRGVS